MNLPFAQLRQLQEKVKDWLPVIAYMRGNLADLDMWRKLRQAQINGQVPRPIAGPDCRAVAAVRFVALHTLVENLHREVQATLDPKLIENLTAPLDPGLWPVPHRYEYPGVQVSGSQLTPEDGIRWLDGYGREGLPEDVEAYDRGEVPPGVLERLAEEVRGMDALHESVAESEGLPSPWEPLNSWRTDGFGRTLLENVEGTPGPAEGSRCQHGRLFIDRCHECLRYPKPEAQDDR